MDNIAIKKYISWHTWLILGFICILLGSFVLKLRGMPGSTMMVLFVSGFLQKDVLKRLKQALVNPYFWCISSVFWIYLIWWWLLPEHYEKDFAASGAIKIPYVLLPLALHLYDPIKPKAQLFIYYFFLLLLTVTALGSTVNYILNFDEINDLILRSKPLPVVINHVRYSLMVAFGIFCSYSLYRKKLSLFNEKIEKPILLGISIFLLGFLHITSVRSGMLAFYIVLVIYIIFYIFQSGKVKQGLVIIAAIIIIPTACLLFVPSFQNKVQNTISDLNNLEQVEKANTHSMVGRLYSYKIGNDLFQEAPVIGVGPQNMVPLIKETYNERFPQITKILVPHNQFLYLLAAVGIIGTLIFLVTFYYPLFHHSNYQRMPILFIHYLIVTSSFLVEATLETQYGANFTLLFIVTPLFFYGKLGYNPVKKYGAE